MKSGVWCVHCEHVTLDGDLAVDGEGDRFCSVCDAGDLDLWTVRGTDLHTGMFIPTGSDLLAAVHVYDDGD